MKKIIKLLTISLIILALFSILFLIASAIGSCGKKELPGGMEQNKANSKKVFETSQEALEYAYFEGQKDAMENVIRIKKNDRGCWGWSESPWDSGKKPIYNPEKDCNKKRENFK